MSKFIIGNKPISRVSGPVRVTVLKPDDDLRNRFKKEGARLPYIILFGDHHFDRENNCEECECKTNWITGEGWENKECCYEIDDPEFLKLFDGVASKNYPIDFYTEQSYEPRLSDPKIYEINPSLDTADKEGYLAKFIHDYKICYSKAEKEKRTPRYKKECPTRDIRWHYIDMRDFTYGNSGDAQLNQGIIIYYNILKKFFYEPEDTVQSKIHNIVITHHYKLQMTLDIILNGMNFLKEYLTIDSDFLIPKQVRKQAIKELRDMDLWNSIIKDNINIIFKKYFKYSDTPFNTNDYMTVIQFYINVLQLISDNTVSKEEFLEKRKELIKSVENYKIFENNQSNLNIMISYTIKIAMMDIYTVARMLKKPKGTPGFLAMYYGGDRHTRNIRDILVSYFSYEIVGESYNEKERCQSVKDIDFNILKAKNEYK